MPVTIDTTHCITEIGGTYELPSTAGAGVAVHSESLPGLIGLSVVQAWTAALRDAASLPVRHQAGRAHAARCAAATDTTHVQSAAALLTLSPRDPKLNGGAVKVSHWGNT